MALAGVLDARMGLHVARPIHRATPYVVVRDKQVVTIQTGLTAGMAVFCPVVGPGEEYITDIIGATIFGTNTLGSGASVVNTTNYSGLVRNRARLHNMTMQVAVTSPPTGSLLPTGTVTCGALKTNIEASSTNTAANWNSFFVNRAELHNPTAYELMMRPRVYHARPMDLVSYDSFNPGLAASSLTGNFFSDSLTPLVVSWPANSVTGQVMVLTVWTEWAVMFTADPILQSMGTLQNVLPDGSWFAAIEAALAATGVAGALRAGGGGMGLARAGARALPAILA